jgi:amino-acid N-acetyltransferase
MVTVDAAAAADLPQVLALLSSHGLPLEGVAEHLGTMVVARRDGAVVGAAALETYADGALLRSVAVARELQGCGLGRRLTIAALEMARARGLRDLFLLTTSADGYFPRFGFERIERAAVPGSVQASIEFRSACPASAIVMRARLDVPK